jgi:very-short-patch-repair endonuclease
MPPTHRPVRTAARFAAAFADAVVGVDDVLAAGITLEELRAAVGRGLVVRVVRGRYAHASAAVALDPWGQREADVQRHLALLRSALGSAPDGTCASHASAAFLLGQATPDWDVPLQASLVRPGAANDTGPGFQIRGSGLHADDVDVVGGIPVTSIERTAVDLARSRSPADALVALDSAARSRIARLTGASGNELRYAVLDLALRSEAARLLDLAYRRCFGWPGTVVVREMLPLVDPASESPLESRSRYWFTRAGLRSLRIGQPLSVGGATYFADFLDERSKVVGEADGWGKYGVDLREQREAWDRERSRQGELESDGYRCVRWTTSDRPRAVLDRMLRALQRHV